MRLRLLALALLAAVGCKGILTPADTVGVGDSLAARIYYEARYERLCPHDADHYLAVDQATVAGCLSFGKLLVAWRDSNDIATEVATAGALPAQEQDELRAYIKAASKLP